MHITDKLMTFAFSHLSYRQRFHRKVNNKFKRNEKRRIKHPENLNLWERKYFSQNGEDGIIDEIINRIGTTTSYYVEFGVENGTECNTR